MLNIQKSKLKDLCIYFNDGNWIESKDQSSEGVRLIQTGNVGNGFFKNRAGKARYISEQTFKQLNCTEIFEGDCLISRLPDPVGRSCIIPSTDEKMITAVDCSIVRFDLSKIIPRYFNYYSQSDAYLNDVEQLTSGTTRKRISRKNLGLIEIHLPSLPEQKRIVKILDEVFEEVGKARENAEKNLRNSRELFESYLQRVFENRGEGWEEERFGEIIQKTETINPLNSPDKDFVYIDVSSVNREKLSIENTTIIKGKNAPSRARKLVKEGDIIFATVRPTLRRIAIIPKELDGHICSTGYVVLRGKEKVIESKFIFYYLQTRDFNEKMEGLQRGTSYPAVTDGDVKNRIIFYPKPLSEQKAVVKKLDTLSKETKKLEEIYKKEIADLEELKKSVLQKAFRGEL